MTITLHFGHWWLYVLAAVGGLVIGGSVVIAPSLEAAMRTTPPRQLGWEGHGAKPTDTISETELASAQLRDATALMVAELKGLSVDIAMTAMHAQRRSDGRPVPYLPEEKI